MLEGDLGEEALIQSRWGSDLPLTLGKDLFCLVTACEDLAAGGWVVALALGTSVKPTSIPQCCAISAEPWEGTGQIPLSSPWFSA